jgi:phosphoenolpyruvate carboxylase
MGIIEDAIHFFLECCLYVEAREQLTNNLQFLDSLLIETLHEEQNAQIFKSVQLYIKQTKRFTPQ